MRADIWYRCEEITTYFCFSWIFTNLDQIIVASFLHAVFIFLFALEGDENISLIAPCRDYPNNDCVTTWVWKWSLCPVFCGITPYGEEQNGQSLTATLPWTSLLCKILLILCPAYCWQQTWGFLALAYGITVLLKPVQYVINFVRKISALTFNSDNSIACFV